MFKIALVFLAVLTKIRYAAALDTTPVLIQDDGLLDGVVNSELNPFKKTTQEEFELIMDKAQKASDTMLFFVEDNLSYEDITSKDGRGTAYYHMRKAFVDKRVKLFLRVVEPYNYIKSRFQPFDFNTFHVRNKATKLRLAEEYKFMYIFFEDGANETRFERLRRHDMIIQEVFFAVKQLSKGTVIAIYTGKQNPVEIAREHKGMLDSDDATTVSPTEMQRITAIKCGSASSFQFEDCAVVTSKASLLKPTLCTFNRAQIDDVWAYHITLVPVDFEDEMDRKKYYELRFIFTFDDMRMKTKGWKLIRIVYLSSRHGVLKTQRADISSPFDQLYENTSPLIMEPDDKSTYEPTLFLKKFRINIKSAELMSVILRHGELFTYPTTTESDESYDKQLLTQSPQDHQTDIQPMKQIPQDKHEDILPIGQGPQDKQKDKQSLRKLNPPFAKEVYVTVAIASSGLVTFIFLWAMFIAVNMMMSIGGNSKLDTPDTKPLYNTDSQVD